MTALSKDNQAELQAAAKAAKLHYVSDTKPGIIRVRTSSGSAKPPRVTTK